MIGSNYLPFRCISLKKTKNYWLKLTVLILIPFTIFGAIEMTCNRIAAAKNGDNTLYSVGLSANILLNVFVIYMNVLAIITAV